MAPISLFLLFLLSSICMYPHQANSKPHNNITDLESLLAFKAQVSDPLGILSANWATNTSFCSWIGITCSRRHQRVISLDLYNITLQGAISPHLANLSFLSLLALGNASLTGPIPNVLGQLPRLKTLVLELNNMSGQIPSSLFNMSSLIELYLSDNMLSGSLPSNLSTSVRCPLQVVALDGNQLTGQIPTTFASFLDLQQFDLSGNYLAGPIPANLGQLPQLKQLGLSRNYLSGKIPSSLFNMSSLIELYLPGNSLSGSLSTNHSISIQAPLQVVALGSNQLTGHIPTTFACFLDLQTLDLSSNNLTGAIPADLGNLPELRILYLFSNNLSGEIPPSLGNLTQLRQLDISENNMSGFIPKELGDLSKLQELFLSVNALTGSIPASLLNASIITKIDLTTNNLVGHVPPALGESMPLLESLFLGHNSLSGNLNFVASLPHCKNLTHLILMNNELEGSLPDYIGNLSTSLLYLYISHNHIKGNIPVGLGNLSNLLVLDLQYNELTGGIPPTLARLHNLQGLKLGHNRIGGPIPSELGLLRSLIILDFDSNQLFGAIPDSMGNLTGLQLLYLDINQLSSKLPQSIWKLKSLVTLQLRENFLFGSIPPEVSNLDILDALDLSENQLSGNISSALGELSMLTHLDLSRNSFHGQIPESLGGLINIQELNLSRNFLSGAIPKSLANLRYLDSLDISFNMLEGEIPKGRVFSNLKIPSLEGNKALCGAPQLGFQPCSTNTSNSHSKGKSRILKYVLPVVAFIVALSCLVLVITIRGRRKAATMGPTNSQHLGSHRVVSYHELVRATNNFSQDNLLGRGSFGSVFRGCLDDGLIVAVKVLNLEVERASKSFDAECQALCSVRHRNLIKIISVCCNLDFKALILPFMPNGSLERWLYSNDLCLNLLQRLNIMVDVASALEHLHHHHHHIVLHCDLKPSNVLLDAEMVAYVSDFGIAKVMLDSNQSIISASTPGTLGYVAPEYGTTGKVSKLGDVYSFGILLLEMLTGKRPTDVMFDGGSSFREWICKAHLDALCDIIDYNLWKECSLAQQQSEEHSTTTYQCLSSIIELGLLCSSYSAKERIPMVDVVIKLSKIKTEYTSHSSMLEL